MTNFIDARECQILQHTKLALESTRVRKWDQNQKLDFEFMFGTQRFFKGFIAQFG